jgi:hypothetical protein
LSGIHPIPQDKQLTPALSQAAAKWELNLAALHQHNRIRMGICLTIRSLFTGALGADADRPSAHLLRTSQEKVRVDPMGVRGSGDYRMPQAAVQEYTGRDRGEGVRPSFGASSTTAPSERLLGSFPQCPRLKGLMGSSERTRPFLEEVATLCAWESSLLLLLPRLVGKVAIWTTQRK